MKSGLLNILSLQDLASLCLSEEKSNRFFQQKKETSHVGTTPYPLRVTTRIIPFLGSGIILTKPVTCDWDPGLGGVDIVPRHDLGRESTKALPRSTVLKGN